MQAAIEQFRLNIVRVKDIGSIANVLDAQTSAALDISDILRSELVMAVSVFDLFVHELVRLGMLDAYRHNRERTPTFLRFNVSLEGAMSGIANSSNDGSPWDEAWIQREIRERNGYLSFQNPDNIASAIRLISEAQLWNEVATDIGMAAQDIRETLRAIITRRNQIAHEADMDPSYPDTLWPIDAQMVDESVELIEQIAEAMYVVVT